MFDYTQGAFLHDPYLFEASHSLAYGKTYANIQHTPEIECGDVVSRSLKYWSFLKGYNVRETAACIKAVSDNIFLIVGLSSDENNNAICFERTLNTMDDWLNESSQYLLEYCLNRTFLDEHCEIVTGAIQAQLPQLTGREGQVVQQLFQGKSNKVISAELTLSEYTIENYLRRIYKKFGVHSRTALITKIRQHSL